jgi:hypothetical protein
MPAVGDFYVDVFPDRMDYPQRQIGVIPGPPGADGDGVIRGGRRSPFETTVRTVTIIEGAEQADADVRAQQMRDLVDSDSAVIVIDGQGRKWPNVRILGVVAEVSATVLTGVFRVDCVWRMKVPVTGPEGP